MPIPSNLEPIVTAEKYMRYKKKYGHFNAFTPPKIILICYQASTLKYLSEHLPDMKPADSFSHLYLIDDGKIGILGGWGFGAPSLAVKMEQLIVLGVNQFIAVGTAGTLMNQHPIGGFILAPSALPEDGVAHHYLNGAPSVKANQEMFDLWAAFAKNHALPHFHEASTWSFSAIFRETPADIYRVTELGYNVVEMEAATLYAIGYAKGVQTLSLFVISDTLTQEDWTPHLREPLVRNNLHKLAKWTLSFCKQEALKNSK